jgi:hypothetical protein
MRSTFKTIAFATIALSLATGGAFAASGHERHERHDGFRGEMGGHDSEPLVQTTPVVMTQAPVYKPRLNHVLAELRATNGKIEHREAMHKLSLNAARKLEGEAGSIRHRAMTVADMHNGAIPKATFLRLKGDIRELDRDIARLS